MLCVKRPWSRRRKSTGRTTQLPSAAHRYADRVLDACANGVTGPRLQDMFAEHSALSADMVRIRRTEDGPYVYFSGTPDCTKQEMEVPWMHYSTPLRMAVTGGHLDTVQYLVQHCDVDITEGRPDTGSLPHNLAASLGQLDIVRFLVGEGLSLVHGSTEAWKLRQCSEVKPDSFVLRSACESGNLELVEYVLTESKLCINIADPINGGTPLECACASGSLEVVQRVVAAGADINATPRHCECCKGWTPMHEAAAYGSAEIITWLVQHGNLQLNDECVGKEGMTPLEMALEIDNLSATRALLACGARLTAPGRNGPLSVLHYQICQHMFKNYPNGYTSLQLCAEFGLVDLAEWLVEHGRGNPHLYMHGSISALERARLCLDEDIRGNSIDAGANAGPLFAPAILHDNGGLQVGGVIVNNFDDEDEDGDVDMGDDVQRNNEGRNASTITLDAREKMVHFLTRTMAPWGVRTHVLFGPAFRRTVRLLFLIHNATSYRAPSQQPLCRSRSGSPVEGAVTRAASSTAVPTDNNTLVLPVEVWMHIMSFLRRGDYDHPSVHRLNPAPLPVPLF